MRSPLLCAPLALLLLLACAAPPPQPAGADLQGKLPGALPKGDLPNILIILADDQGVGDVGYTVASAHQPGAGGRRYTPNPPRTPHLDALAADDATMLLDRFYSGSPVCSPTRASLLTGRTPDRECVFNAEGCGQEPAWACVNPQPFPGGYSSGAGVFTVADAATSAGYATLHVGKW